MLVSASSVHFWMLSCVPSASPGKRRKRRRVSAAAFFAASDEDEESEEESEDGKTAARAKWRVRRCRVARVARRLSNGRSRYVREHARLVQA